MYITEAHMTQTTRDMLTGRKPPRVNMTNAKPFRNKDQKADARSRAEKKADGAYRSPAPVSYHKTIPVGA